MKKVLGLILELNPYHNGHRYFIDEAIKKINPDVTIAIISSSFMMRGDPMVIDKFSRTKILLNYNIDLVVELPFISGVNNSNYFCENAVKILNEFKVTDICFGSESDNIEELYKLVNLNESLEYEDSIKKYLNQGYSYSTSSTKAILEITNDIEITNKFSLPNNTLGIGYLKAIKNTKIKPHIIKRIDNNYYDDNVNINKFNSATSIRNELRLNNDISSFIPNYNYDFYNPNDLENNLFKLLQYSLINISNYDNIKEVNEGIENRLINFINSDNYDSFINNVKSKRYSINKIKRLILYILLYIPKYYENKYCYYLRILGMNDNGKKHISSLNKETKNKIITSFKNIDNELVNIELKVTKLYGIITNNYDIYKQEYNIPFRKEKL